jgi:hypothetical protein
MNKKTNIVIDLDRVYDYKVPNESMVERVDGHKLYYDKWVLYQKTGLNNNQTIRTVIKLYQSDSFKLENRLNRQGPKGYMNVCKSLVVGSGIVND